MTFRDWTKEDIPEIGGLERACFSDPWNKEMLESFFSSPHFSGVLCEKDGRICGYACGSVLFETAEIAIVAVAKEYRRQGLGRELLQRLENKARAQGAEESFLEVRAANTPAKELYRNNGYAEISVRKKYYPDGEDAFVMRKSL